METLIPLTREDGGEKIRVLIVDLYAYTYIRGGRGGFQSLENADPRFQYDGARSFD